MNVSRGTLAPTEFFDLKDVWFSDLFKKMDLPWEVLRPKRKEEWIRNRMKPNVGDLAREGHWVKKDHVFDFKGQKTIIEAGSYIVGDEIEFRPGVHIEAGAWVCGPTILGEGTLVRQGAYLRGGILTGHGVVLGHTTEVKSSIFLNEAKAAHFAYVGDSILGNGVNLGAGTKISNLKITNDEVVLRAGSEVIRSGLRKFGAILGDQVQTGCNSVLNPGVLLGRGCLVYPCVSVRNRYYEPGSRIR